MTTYNKLFTPEEISNEISARISRACPSYFNWMAHNFEALESLRTTCEVFIGNMTGIVETKKLIDEISKYDKLVESVNNLEKQMKESRNESLQLWVFYYTPIKIIEKLKEEINKSNKNLHSYGFKKRNILKYIMTEDERSLKPKDALICNLAIIFEYHYNKENKSEPDLLNFPVSRSEIFTKTLSPNDISPSCLNSKDSESIEKQKNRTTPPIEKALFFKGAFYWMVWGVFEILDIPHRDQSRKVDNGEFQNLCDDSHAFAKKIFRALDANKTNIIGG